jgi:glutathione-regulated potassium-efflux system ancillary protein KefG
MEYLPPFVVHGTHMLEEGDIVQYAEDYRNVVVALRDELFSDSDLAGHSYFNDVINKVL